MKRCLAVATLALGLIAFGGCDDEDDNTGTGGRGGTGGPPAVAAAPAVLAVPAAPAARTGGTGGTTTGGTGGTTTGGTGGTTTGGTGGGTDAAEVGAEAGAETAAETGGETAASLCAAYIAGSGMLAGIEAQAFCTEYATACTFGGAMRYTNMGDCMTKYMAAATAVKTCRAGHLCNASARQCGREDNPLPARNGTHASRLHVSSEAPKTPVRQPAGRAFSFNACLRGAGFFRAR